MRRLLHITRFAFKANLAYRFTGLFTLLTNLFYVVVMYFLWRSIYQEKTVIRGMTFDQAFVYMTFAGSVVVLFTTYSEWIMSDHIVQGTITVDMLRPLDYQMQRLFQSMGFLLFNLLLITAPTAVVIVLFFRADMVTGINLLFFPVSLLLAYLISFAFDYVVGVTAFYTESIWGIVKVKEVLILLLSGALIPLRFFPEGIQNALRFLPFQAIYNLPLTILTDPVKPLAVYGRMLGVQAFWAVGLLLAGRLYFRQASKVLTVAGG